MGVAGLSDSSRKETLENKGFRRYELASIRGFEPPTPRLGGECSIQLSYMDVSNI